jgi:AraC-like DNA-binding protein/putative intracellular protease/amidase
VIVMPGAYLSSIGTVCDAFALLASHVRMQFPDPSPYRMQTAVRLIGMPDAPSTLADGRPLPLDGDLLGALGAAHYRAIYLPAFLGGDQAQLERTLDTVGAVLSPWLREQHARGATVAASGTAVLLLAQAGLLDQGHAAVLALLEALCRQRYPRVHADRHQAVVTWDRLHTCGNPAGEWALALRLIEDVVSPHAAQWLASATGLQAGLQPGLHKGPMRSDDPMVARAQFWLAQHHTQACRIDELAAQLAVSHSTLTRRFQRVLGKTPRDYVRQLRVHAAQQLLRSTRRASTRSRCRSATRTCVRSERRSRKRPARARRPGAVKSSSSAPAPETVGLRSETGAADRPAP